MAKKVKSPTKKSKVGQKFTTGVGYTYTLLSENSVDGIKIFKYKWHECPDPEFIIESKKELDSLDMGEQILQYKLNNRMYRH